MLLGQWATSLDGCIASLSRDGRDFPDKPGSGACRIEADEDVDDVIALMRLNYERAVARHGLPDRGGRVTGIARKRSSR